MCLDFDQLTLVSALAFPIDAVVEHHGTFEINNSTMHAYSKQNSLFSAKQTYVQSLQADAWVFDASQIS